MGMRKWMPSLLLHVRRPADALYFAQQWLECHNPPSSAIDFVPPRHTPMPATQCQQVAKYADLQMSYSAALAAFMLDGDSELARQCLHIAVHHPAVLVKVLGKFKERGTCARAAFIHLGR
jgi:hypothetical protein